MAREDCIDIDAVQRRLGFGVLSEDNYTNVFHKEIQTMLRETYN